MRNFFGCLLVGLIIFLTPFVNVSAALTSAPIYAPCITSFVRTDVGTCSGNGNLVTTLPPSTCVVLTVPKSRSISVQINYTIKANAAVGKRELRVDYHHGYQCNSLSDIRYLSIYEQVITPLYTVLNQDTYVATAYTVSDKVSLIWYKSVGTEFDVTYAIVEYKDR